MADQPLPSPRALLTSLISTVAAPHQEPSEQPASAAEPSKPLRDLASERRTLLSTLHVIFPSLLLPALDLLDRGLVTRLFLAEETAVTARHAPVEVGGGAGEGEEARNAQPRDAPQGQGQGPRQRPAGHSDDLLGGGEDGVPTGGLGSGRGGVYIVRSTASTMRRKTEAKTYLVLSTSWSCTCPSFAFDAFPPPRTPGNPTHPPPPPPTTEQKHRAATGKDGDWSFGGLSLDGQGRDGGVPCCKHLLACVLAERWGHILERYVPRKGISRAAMAGLIAEV